VEVHTEYSCPCAFQGVLRVFVLHAMENLTRRSFQRQALVASALAVLHVFESLDHSGRPSKPERGLTSWIYSIVLMKTQ
jgi:hypothetical protein